MRSTARTYSFPRILCGVLFSLTLTLPSEAASPRDELLRLVPEDIGFCVVVQNLKKDYNEVLQSPFVEQFSQSDVGVAVGKSTEAAHLFKLRDLFLNNIGLNAESIRDDVLGQAVVFAYKPGPPGKPDQEEGLILIRASNEKVLTNLIDKLNTYQKKAGDLKDLEEKEHKGIKYVRRVEKKDATYYCLRGPILLLTSQEAMLHRALDKDHANKSDNEPLLVKRLRDLDADRALLTFWINPRAFDAAIEAKASQAEGGQAAALKTFTRYWKSLDGGAFSVLVDKDLSFSLSLRARTEQLPEAARRFLEAASRPSLVWQTFPEDALYAEASRVDLASYLDLLGDFLTKENREGLHTDLDRYLGAPLGKNFVKEVLPFIGPDWGLCVTAPRPGTKTWLPEGVCALRISSGGESAAVDKAVLSGIHALAMLGVVAHNKQYPERTLRLLTLKQGDREIKYLAGDTALTPGLRPAIAMNHGFLIAATSPELVNQFSDRLSTLLPTDSTGTIPIMRISFKAWRTYLTEHREPMVEMIAKQNNMEKNDAAERIDRLLSGLQFFDRFEINQRASAGKLILTLRLQTTQPLRK